MCSEKFLSIVGTKECNLADLRAEAHSPESVFLVSVTMCLDDGFYLSGLCVAV